MLKKRNQLISNKLPDLGELQELAGMFNMIIIDGDIYRGSGNMSQARYHPVSKPQYLWYPNFKAKWSC